VLSNKVRICTKRHFRTTKSKFLQEDQLTNHPKLQPTTFRKTPQDKANRSVLSFTVEPSAVPAITSLRTLALP